MDKAEKQTQIDKAFPPPPEGRGLHADKTMKNISCTKTEDLFKLFTLKTKVVVRSVLIMMERIGVDIGNQNAGSVFVRINTKLNKKTSRAPLKA